MITARRAAAAFVAVSLALHALAADLASLLPERLKSIVAVEFTIQTEIERRQVVIAGTVIDDRGTIIIPGTNIPNGLGIDQLKDFKVYLPEQDDSTPAVYLGQDELTGFHFVRATDGLLAKLKPITAFAKAPEPSLGTELWGLGLRGKDEDFKPYALTSRVAMIATLPNKTALTSHDLGAPGLPVFDGEGRLVGLTLSSFGQNYLLFSRTQHGTPVMLVNADESSVVLLAEEFLPYLNRVPTSPTGRPVTSIGIYGLQPVDPDVAKLLKLEHQSGLVVSDILEDSPAAKAGLQDRDIVLAIDGKPLPRLRPDRSVVGYFGQEVLKRHAGDAMTLTVLRGTERREVKVTLGEEPKMVRESERRYFERLGFTAREFLTADLMAQRAKPAEMGGAVVNFVRPNSPVANAGLRPDDWIREIDGIEVRGYADAIEKLAAVENDKARAEFVLLTRRGGETQVLRVKLN
jgi:serine protease Do